MPSVFYDRNFLSLKFHNNVHTCASRVDTTLTGVYDLVPAVEGAQEGGVNALVADQVPPEPEANLAQEDKSLGA